MPVLLPLLLLLGTDILVCSIGIERCHEAGGSRSRGGGGRWVLMGKGGKHVLTLSRIMSLASSASPTSDKVLQNFIRVLCTEPRIAETTALTKQVGWCSC